MRSKQLSLPPLYYDYNAVGLVSWWQNRQMWLVMVVMVVADLEPLLSPLLILFIFPRPENQRQVARCFPFQPHHILAITILPERKSLVRLIIYVSH
jgi:hypothetical protein